MLFATDIASRGLDFPKVDWVFQLDCTFCSGSLSSVLCPLSALRSLRLWCVSSGLIPPLTYPIAKVLILWSGPAFGVADDVFAPMFVLRLSTARRCCTQAPSPWRRTSIGLVGQHGTRLQEKR